MTTRALLRSPNAFVLRLFNAAPYTLFAATLAATALSCGSEKLEATAFISVQPETLGFGRVAVGDAQSLILTVFNDSKSADLLIEEAILEEGSAPVFAVMSPNVPVPPQTSVEIVVRYTPDDDEPDAGVLLLRSNAINARVLKVPLTSERTLPRLDVFPLELHLGALPRGGRAEGVVTLDSTGDATVFVSRIALRTSGFLGEPCQLDANCFEGSCRPNEGGSICTTACDAGCPADLSCASFEGQDACRPAPGAPPPQTARGFSIVGNEVPPIAPQTVFPLRVLYEPADDDRGPAQLLIDSNDRSQPTWIIPLLGRPDNLPPTAMAEFAVMPTDPIGPGTRIEISGDASFDPEGDNLTYRWRFVTRPEESLAQFADPNAARTEFTVDRPGRYVAALEVADASGRSSTNDARVELDAVAGRRVRIDLEWDRADTDLDLHLAGPGSALGSSGDCWFDRPNTTWEPPGPDGDCNFTFGPTTESIAVDGPGDGVYTVAVMQVAPSPGGEARATVRVFYEDVLVASYVRTIPQTAIAWDIATLSRPSGAIVRLDGIR